MQQLKQVLKILYSILISAIIVFAGLLVAARISGMQVFAVLSGSMEPTYPTGSLLYVKKVDYLQLKTGDPITFLLDEKTVATHRIVEVIPDETDSETLRFRTKGDANEAVDGGLVHCKNVIGKPVFAIPYLGYVSTYIQKPPGIYFAIAFGIVILSLAFLPDLFADERTENGGSKKTDQASL